MSYNDDEPFKEELPDELDLDADTAEVEPDIDDPLLDDPFAEDADDDEDSADEFMVADDSML